MTMRIYLKYVLVVFILIWTVGVFYMFVSNDTSRSSGSSRGEKIIDANLKNSMFDGDGNGDDSDAPKSPEQYKREFNELKAHYQNELEAARGQIAQLNQINNENQELITQLKKQVAEKDNINPQKNPKNSDSNSNSNSQFSEFPSKSFEDTRRKIFQDAKDLSYYVNTHLGSQIQSKNPKIEDLTRIKDNINHRILVLIGEIYNLSISNNLGEWRTRESSELSAQVNKRIAELQNPADCESSKKIICDLSKACGFGCQMHHVMYCFITAWYTNRTMILESAGWRYNSAGFEAYFKPLSDTCKSTKDNALGWNQMRSYDDGEKALKMPIIDVVSSKPKFLPLAVPKELKEKLGRFHGDPFVWWSGHILAYLMRFNSEFEATVQKTKEELKFKTPCVGVHIRRTDKIGTEASFHSLEEYMQHVDEFFQVYELRTGLSGAEYERSVYLASDEPKVFDEARSKYKGYRFVFDERNAQTAQLNQRYTPDSAQGVILDIHMLSECDYLVCTFSSQVCRMAYELMQVRYPDASWRFRSLDDVYYFGGQNPHNVVAIFDHTPAKSDEIELKRGDLVGLAGNHWNGYSKGRNRRTNQEGLFPSYKVADVIEYY